jgi:DNA-binding response OmpR family regulator
MDGHAAARTLRARAEFSGVPIIAMTGYGRDEDFQRSEAAGIDRHLVKPIAFDLLESILADQSMNGAGRFTSRSDDPSRILTISPRTRHDPTASGVATGETIGAGDGASPRGLATRAGS